MILRYHNPSSLSKGIHHYHPEYPYRLLCDILAFNFWLSGPEHYKYLVERIPELKWVRENCCNTDPIIFKVAKEQVGSAIPMTYIMDNPQKFSIYKMTQEQIDRAFWCNRTKNEYSQILLDAQNDPKVIEERRQNTIDYKNYYKERKELIDKLCQEAIGKNLEKLEPEKNTSVPKLSII